MSNRAISAHEPPWSVDTSTMQKSKPCSVSQIWSYSSRELGGSMTGTPNVAVAFTVQPLAPVGQLPYVPAGLSVSAHVPEAAIGVVPHPPSVIQFAAAPDSKSSAAKHVTRPANSYPEARAVSVPPFTPDTS